MQKNDCKANWYNEDGGKVGKGLGDLNPPRGALKSVETKLSAEEIARKSMTIAADICVYTNHNLVAEEIKI